ncbi:MAG: 50S ribosomal protein L6 [Roseibacillus sp.]|jgi:large subunit ribosomal protein L6|nr:50S ribosomal protein L6 [Roseibacillus sp.]MDP7306729.1 50S ribosomal protein L6 [Roseibacillus sp.]HJM62786.1 50S ribosomal protein L6 [Roseibacillus sp.]|tara:strand:- start:529 stop:1071 length:543 start_codon:yes stop_codon:yes gene_type:complete
MSRVGQKNISLPDKVSINIGNNGEVTVEGPKGKLEWQLPVGISVDQEDSEVTVKRENDQRRLRALHGTARSLINNMIEGVSNGFTKELELQGVGFRAAVKGNKLDLSLGKSHPILHPIPDGITVTVTDNTKIKVEGTNKQVVGQFTAEVRNYYPPEPYKGKGVRYVGEYVRRKAGKSVQA